MSDNEGTGRNGNESRSRRELLGLAGFLGWSLHPDWLANLLS